MVNGGTPQGGFMMKKRPITAANRMVRNHVSYGVSNSKKGTIVNGFIPNKNPSSLDLEVSRMRPKNIKQERERLYDDAMRQKMVSNMLKDENVKLKTKIHILESEINKKERLVDDLLLQQDNFTAGVVSSA